MLAGFNPTHFADIVTIPGCKVERTAIRLMPDDKSAAPAYKNLGLLLFDENADPKQIVGLWNHFLRLDPSDPQAPAIRTQIAKLQARKGQ